MPKQITSYPKLHTEEPPEAPPRLQGTDLEEFCQAFTQATGWPLRFVENPPLNQDPSLMWSAPVTPGVGTSLGHLRLDFNASRKTTTTRVKAEAAQRLAAWGSRLFGQLAGTRHALWQREAELAAGIPLSQRPDEKQHLASRLAAAVQGGAEAVDCQAAALYLLDEATTELKMRSCWGLPAERLLEPPRALKLSMADLEALAGHAVVLEDSKLMGPWNVPEKFASAVCVPVSSPTVPLGTLWMFCDRPRFFSDIQMNVLEIIAGRLSADLEREMLLHELTQHRATQPVELAREIDSAGQLQRNQLPTVAPLSDTWSIAGWTSQAGKVGGAFHDWFHLANDSLAIVAANSRGQGVEAALSAQMLRTAVSVHGQYSQTPDQLMAQVNHTLWSGSAGGQFAWLFYAVLDSGTHTVEYSFSGKPSLLLLYHDGWDSLLNPALPLGLEPETTFERSKLSLEPGQVLVIFNRSVREAAVAEALTGHLDLPAQELLVKVRHSVESLTADRPKDDLAVLVVKRR